MRRLVLDTHVLVCARLFQQGRLGWLRHDWQSRQVTRLLCRSTVDELLRVLACLKIRLERDAVIAFPGDPLPYAQSAELPASPPQAPLSGPLRPGLHRPAPPLRMPTPSSRGTTICSCMQGIPICGV